jgi:FtsP/CotA-like multicopper oxidase with cupredoxin domain
MKAGADLRLALRAADNDAFIAANCTGDALPQHLIAADGLTAAAVIKTDTTIFQPGYRWDDLVVFPEPGNYCVYDAPISRTGNVSQLTESRRLLGVVRVAPGFLVRDTTAFVTAELTRAAATNMPEGIRSKVIADLKDGLKLSHFTPHPRVDPSEVRGKRDITFNIAPPAGPAGGPQFHINGQSFQPGRIDQTLELGSVEEWTLKSNVIGHPFHIHVNPFQIVAILDPDGKDVSGPDAQDGPDGSVDPQYRGLKGVWKDTIFVKNGTPFPAPPGSTSKPYTVVVRTRYERYIGDFVLHCHILDHEDQGMMQLVRVALPDGVGGIAQAHHASPPSAAPKKPQTSQATAPRAANQFTRANAPVRP